jgi:phage protein U
VYAQLGQILFEGVFGFDAFQIKGTANYAQHDLINVKPVLQPTGNDLDQLTVDIKLRSNFINVAAAVLSLQKSRDTYEVLPLVRGTGQYMGDFVITEMTVTESQTLADGTVVEALINMVLSEYVVADKLQQQQSSARKQAFATGNNSPFALNIEQKPTIPQLAAGDISEANSNAAVIDRKASEWANNVSKRQSIANKIQQGLNKMDDALQRFTDRLDEITILDDVASMLSAAAVVRQYIQDFQFPITNISDLQDNNRDLQNVVRNLGTAITQLFNLVITRAA